MAAMVQRGAIEAARGALVAIHAAAGLAGTGCRDAARMLRAAEGLVRTAVATLVAPTPSPSVARVAAVPGRSLGGASDHMGGTRSEMLTWNAMTALLRMAKLVTRRGWALK